MNCARRRDRPTRVVEHGCDHCPDGGTPLRGGAVVQRRQVLHLPRVPVEVIEHVVRRRTCPHCGRACRLPLDLGDQVLGRHRVSVATMADVASLRAVGRLPLRTIQWLLVTLQGLRLSMGALVGLRKAVADRAQPALDALRAQMRGSPVVCADETGWREDGVAGYVWIFSTPMLRSFHDDHRRAGAVVQEVLGAGDDGTLVSDCYAADNIHEGAHQRCWPHLLRDSPRTRVRVLRVAHPDAALAAWAEGVHARYLEAQQVAARDADFAARVAARDAPDRRLTALCAPSWGPDSTVPQATLCQRIDRFLDELVAFVLDVAIPADNNLAERSLRRLVIARQSSGGTRSPDGSRVRMALVSLFAAWLAQGRNPLAACYQLLLAPAG